MGRALTHHEFCFVLGLARQQAAPTTANELAGGRRNEKAHGQLWCVNPIGLSQRRILGGPRIRSKPGRTHKVARFRLKGANSRVALFGRVGRIAGVAFSFVFRGLLGRSFAVVVAWTSRTSSCWSCATSSRSCVVMARGRSLASLIVRCSRRRPATSHRRCAARVWSPRGRCRVGIALAPQVAPVGRPARATAHAWRGAGPGAARESALGPSADHRRGGQTGLRGLAHDCPSAVGPRGTGTGGAEVRSRLARVPTCSGGGHRRLRRPHRRQRVPTPLPVLFFIARASRRV